MFFIILLIYYIVSVIGAFIIFNYAHYIGEKDVYGDVSFFEIIDVDVYLKITVISFFSGWFYLPYTIIQLIIEKINENRKTSV
jgi:hypothetical protein